MNISLISNNLYLKFCTLLFLGCFFLIQSCQQSPQIYYVQNQKLFSEFEGRKELTKKFEAWEYVFKGKLDSLELHVTQLRNSNAENEAIRIKESEYMQVYQEYTKKAEELHNRYTEQVWSQLNSYLDEYGNENGIKFILGATGDGGLMYASEEFDITSKIIHYANSRYQGE